MLRLAPFEGASMALSATDEEPLHLDAADEAIDRRQDAPTGPLWGSIIGFECSKWGVSASRCGRWSNWYVCFQSDFLVSLWVAWGPYSPCGHAMPCHAMPCHAMPFHAIPCHDLMISKSSYQHHTITTISWSYHDRIMLRYHRRIMTTSSSDHHYIIIVISSSPLSSSSYHHHHSIIMPSL